MRGPTPGPWPEADRRLRRETHYDGRSLSCYGERPASLAALFAGTARRHAASEAVIDGERRLTYGELDRLSASAAGQLARRGIAKGERVALLLGNRAEFVILVVACARLGAIAVPLGVRLKAPELADALDDSAAAALVYESAFAGNLPPADRLPRLRVRILIDGEAPGAALFAPAEPPAVAIDEEETATILYTSGTTGRPKGAMLTHLGIIHSAMTITLCPGLGRADRAIMAVPASHVTGLVAILWGMIACGGCTIMMRAFKARDFLELAAAERLTYTCLVPAQYNLCLMQGDLGEFDLSSWRIGAFGGAPMPESTITALAAALPKLALANAYGATETTSPTSMMPLGRQAAHLDSVGCIVPGGEVRVVDDSGRGVPPGAAGEIWIKGPMVVPGYWQRPDANAAEFVDGFWRSGDIGALDAAGYLRIFDRKKDMINRAGYKIFSAEVENVLSHHPAILESAVIGVPDPVLGERVKALILPRESGLTAEAVRAFCADRLADYKVPEFITLVDAPLPRNANGKLQKALLRGR